MSIYETIGMAGSALILWSMSMPSTTPGKNIRMRIINMLGSVFFVVYGLLIPAYSTAFMNMAMICVHVYYIYKLIPEYKESKCKSKSNISANTLIN